MSEKRAAERASMSIIAKLLNPRIKAKTWNIDSIENVCVAVIAAPFNRYTKGKQPDASNAAIAQLAERICARTNLPFIGQWEQTSILGRDGVRVIQYGNGYGDWVQTHVLVKWVAHQVGDVDTSNRKVVLIGHPHHVRRVAILACYYGLAPFVANDSAHVPYDPSDRPGAQWWCKSKTRYIPWEYVSRAVLIVLALLGKL